MSWKGRDYGGGGKVSIGALEGRGGKLKGR